MDDCIICIPKVHLNPQTVAIAHLISLLLVLFHRLHQTFSSKQNINAYPSLLHYRKAANLRSTYFVNLLLVKKILTNELHGCQTHQDILTSQANSNRRRNPTCRRVDGVVPTCAKFASTLLTQTPKKIKLLQSKLQKW